METGVIKDLDRLRVVFNEFRQLGYWARMSQDNGWRAVPEDILERAAPVVFWHENATVGSIAIDGTIVAPLHLHHFNRDASEIISVLERHGFDAVIENGAGVVLLPTQGQHKIATDVARSMLGRRFLWTMTARDGSGVYLDVLVSDVDEAGKRVRLVIEDYPDTFVTMPLKVLAESIVCGVTVHEEPYESQA